MTKRILAAAQWLSLLAVAGWLLYHAGAWAWDTYRRPIDNEQRINGPVLRLQWVDWDDATMYQNGAPLRTGVVCSDFIGMGGTLDLDRIARHVIRYMEAREDEN